MQTLQILIGSVLSRSALFGYVRILGRWTIFRSLYLTEYFEDSTGHAIETVFFYSQYTL